ncbi:MAG: acyl-ACP thioesterase domain-containing protein [Bacteroidales bacterium]|jgi:acyl-ACP thioesterase
MQLKKLEKKYSVHVYDTGPDGRASLCALFNFMQDIASEHADILGFGRSDLLKSNHFWILSRMYAEISELPCWGDTVKVLTWPNGTEKLFAMRNYEILLPDGRSSTAASSSWLIVDRTTKKINRPDNFLAGFSEAVQAGIRNPGKLPEPVLEGEVASELRVRISDLDMNHHTNNVSYLRWINDSYDPDFVTNHFPCSAEINYLSESVYNDNIVVRSLKAEGDDSIYSHSVFRTDDNKELCRIRLGWRKRS